MAMAGCHWGPFGRGCLYPQTLAVGERMVTQLKINALNTDSRPTPPSKRNAQNLPLKATDAWAGKPGGAVSPWAAVGGNLRLDGLQSCPLRTQAPASVWRAVLSVALPSVRETLKGFRKRYAASFCVLFAFLK